MCDGMRSYSARGHVSEYGVKVKICQWRVALLLHLWRDHHQHLRQHLGTVEYVNQSSPGKWIIQFEHMPYICNFHGGLCDCKIEHRGRLACARFGRSSDRDAHLLRTYPGSFRVCFRKPTYSATATFVRGTCQIQKLSRQNCAEN